MSRLVRLYPKVWRDRYEAEFIGLLEERPPMARDIVDMLRGAVDAHLHPQLARGEIEPSPWTHRLPGLLALAGGLLYAGWILHAGLWTEAEWGNAIMWSFLAMFLSLPGDYMAAHGRQIAVGIGLIAALVVVGNILGWPVGGFAIVGAYVIAFGGTLTLAAIRAGIGSRRRWLLLAVAIVPPLATMVLAAFGFITVSLIAAAAILPYGLAWALIGLRLAIRGSATFVDDPMIILRSEVRQA